MSAILLGGIVWSKQTKIHTQAVHKEPFGMNLKSNYCDLYSVQRQFQMGRKFVKFAVGLIGKRYELSVLQTCCKIYYGKPATLGLIFT